MFGTKKQEDKLAEGSGSWIGSTSYSVIQDPRDDEVLIWNNGKGDPPDPWARVSGALNSLSLAEKVASRIKTARDRKPPD